jgi:flagellar basal-body rod protein FlgF
MSDVYQITSVGMLEGRQRLEAISMNAASASLTGYRRHIVTGRTFDAALKDAGAIATLPVQIDLQPGALVATGHELDLAVEGEDSFFALTDGAQIWLTRAGSFRVSDDGVLVGEGGLHVVGTHGDVRLPGSDVEVAADGRITRAGLVLATLQLFRPNDRTSLQPARGALLAAPAGVLPAEPGEARVRAGVLEASNSDSAREMLGLMALSRQFESLTRVVQGYDELVGRTIQKLGEG